MQSLHQSIFTLAAWIFLGSSAAKENNISLAATTISQKKNIFLAILVSRQGKYVFPSLFSSAVKETVPFLGCSADHQGINVCGWLF